MVVYYFIAYLYVNYYFASIFFWEVKHTYLSRVPAHLYGSNIILFTSLHK